MADAVPTTPLRCSRRPLYQRQDTLLRQYFSPLAQSLKGRVADGSSFGDTSPGPEPAMTAEPNFVTSSILGALTIIDCPGSVELEQDARTR